MQKSGESMTKEEKQIIELRKELRELKAQRDTIEGNHVFYQ